jgi:Ricin-type beta-trefoil lectin domain-like
MRLNLSRRLATRIKVGTLAVAAATTGAVFAPAPAYANTPRVEIVNVSTGLRADVIGASKADGQNVFLWPNNTSASQEFDLVNMGGGFFQLRARHSFKCLMLDQTQPGVGDGRRLAQYPCTDASYRSAQWSFQDMNGGCPDTALCTDLGRRIIKNRYSGRCIDAANASGKKPPRESYLQTWTCITSTSAWNADNQIWKIYDPVARQTVTRPS